MPSPSTALSTLRPELAGSFQEFDLEMDARGFVGLRVLPVVNVVKSAGTFGKIKVASLLANRDTKRAPGSGYVRQRYEFEKESFSTEEHGAEEPVDDKEAVLYGDYLQAEQVATARARDVVMRNYEIRAAALIFNTGTWSPTGITNEWDDHANAVPITDVETAVAAIYDACGLPPNAMVINWKVFRNLRNCAQVVDRLKYAGFNDPKAQSITAEILAQVFDLEMIIVAGGKKNTKAEGVAAVLDDIWSDEYAWIGRVATSGDIKEPCVGRTFHYSEDGSQIGGVVESYREEQTRSDIIRVRQDTDEKVLYSACGAMLGNVSTN
jgi:hypothetical protein